MPLYHPDARGNHMAKVAVVAIHLLIASALVGNNRSPAPLETNSLSVSVSASGGAPAASEPEPLKLPIEALRVPLMTVPLPEVIVRLDPEAPTVTATTMPEVAQPSPQPPSTQPPSTQPPSPQTSTAKAGDTSGPGDAGSAAKSLAGTQAMQTAVLADSVGCDRPEYPVRAVRKGEAGTVSLAILVNPDGSVAKSRVHQSSGSIELDRAARAALSLCKFKPAIANGVPAQGWVQLAYEWTLN